MLRDAQCLQWEIYGRDKCHESVSSAAPSPTNHHCGIRAHPGGIKPHRSPRDLEDPQEPYAAEDGDTERRHDSELHQDGLHDAATHHETVEAVKERHKVGLQPQAVHLHQHLQGEHGQEDFVGDVCGETEQQNLSDAGRPGGLGHEADQSGTNPGLRSASPAGCSAQRRW